MNHDEQRIWLIKQLLAERSDVADVEIPVGEKEQKDLLRGLMNIRMPDPISEATYACINFEEALCPEEIKDQAILITGDIGEVLKELKT